MSRARGIVPPNCRRPSLLRKIATLTSIWICGGKLFMCVLPSVLCVYHLSISLICCELLRSFFVTIPYPSSASDNLRFGEPLYRQCMTSTNSYHPSLIMLLTNGDPMDKHICAKKGALVSPLADVLFRSEGHLSIQTTRGVIPVSISYFMSTHSPHIPQPPHSAGLAYRGIHDTFLAINIP